MGYREKHDHPSPRGSLEARLFVKSMPMALQVLSPQWNLEEVGVPEVRHYLCAAKSRTRCPQILSHIHTFTPSHTLPRVELGIPKSFIRLPNAALGLGCSVH